MNVYFDNAATTSLAPEVLEVMLPYMQDFYGNPSSIHAHGRKTRAAIEKARRTIATLLNTSPSEIFFTSGGTEADNFAITSSIHSLELKHAITSPIEHHAVLHTLQSQAKLGNIKLSLVEIDKQGNPDLNHLEELLKNNPRSLVSLMHGNNEIGNLNDLYKISEICKGYEAIFHSDTVQTMGHYPHDLQTIPVDFIVGAGHKFHGPKGVGFLYIKATNKINPLIQGGAQERNMRGGTENLYGIIGIAKALELAYQDMEAHQQKIKSIKQYMIEKLQTEVEGISFNGESGNLENSLYTVLNVAFPSSDANDMLMFNLDIQQISVSGGSACSSGSNTGSHVLNAIQVPADRGSVRFSFSRYNEKEEVDYVVAKIKETLGQQTKLDTAHI